MIRLFGKLKDEIMHKINLSTNIIIGDITSSLDKAHKQINSHITQESRRECKNTIEYQKHIIESLCDALCNKFEKGFLIVSRDGEIPIVICNGKTLTDDNTIGVTLVWNGGELPKIEINGNEYDYEEESAINVRRSYQTTR